MADVDARMFAALLPCLLALAADLARAARRTRDSQGCIALPKPDRKRMHNDDKRWLRVVR